VGKFMTTAASEFDSCKNLTDTVTNASDDNWTSNSTTGKVNVNIISHIA
jgi:hypothetical protein